MDKNAIVTESAPPPGGPYSQGVVSGDLVFVAGQGGFNPEDGSLPHDLLGQAEQAFRNVEAMLAPGMQVEIDAIACRSS